MYVVGAKIFFKGQTWSKLAKIGRLNFVIVISSSVVGGEGGLCPSPPPPAFIHPCIAVVTRYRRGPWANDWVSEGGGVSAGFHQQAVGADLRLD